MPKLFACYDPRARNPYVGLALDEALCFYLAKKGKKRDIEAGLRLWRNSASIILGRTCKMSENLISVPPTYKSAVHKRGFLFSKKHLIYSQAFPLCRRISGGGTVLHGEGSLNYTFFLNMASYPWLFPIKDSYRMLLSIITQALAAQGISSSLQGDSDIALRNKKGQSYKCSGNAQFRRWGVLVLHGTLITKMELLADIQNSLLQPPKEPDYRSGRKHEEFLSPLPESFCQKRFYSDVLGLLQKLSRTSSAQMLPCEDRRFVYSTASCLAQWRYSMPLWICEGQSSYVLKAQV